MNCLYKLSNILKELRLQFGFSQEEVAKKLDISYQSYQNYEYGKSIPKLKYLVKLADIYDVSLDFLIGRKEYWLI